MPAPGPTERQKGREDEQVLPRKAESVSCVGGGLANNDIHFQIDHGPKCNAFRINIFACLGKRMGPAWPKCRQGRTMSVRSRRKLSAEPPRGVLCTGHCHREIVEAPVYLPCRS